MCYNRQDVADAANNMMMMRALPIAKHTCDDDSVMISVMQCKCCHLL